MAALGALRGRPGDSPVNSGRPWVLQGCPGKVFRAILGRFCVPPRAFQQRFLVDFVIDFPSPRRRFHTQFALHCGRLQVAGKTPLSTCYSLLAACYLLPAVCCLQLPDLLPATCYLGRFCAALANNSMCMLSATCAFPAVICYLLLAACDLSATLPVVIWYLLLPISCLLLCTCFFLRFRDGCHEPTEWALASSIYIYIYIYILDSSAALRAASNLSKYDHNK